MKIRPEETELFHADGRTERQTEMTKPIVACCNFAKAPKTLLVAYITYLFVLHECYNKQRLFPYTAFTA